MPVFAAQCEEVLDSAGLPGYHGKTHLDPTGKDWTGRFLLQPIPNPPLGHPSIIESYRIHSMADKICQTLSSHHYCQKKGFDGGVHSYRAIPEVQYQVWLNWAIMQHIATLEELAAVFLSSHVADIPNSLRTQWFTVLEPAGSIHIWGPFEVLKNHVRCSNWQLVATWKPPTRSTWSSAEASWRHSAKAAASCNAALPLQGDGRKDSIPRQDLGPCCTCQKFTVLISDLITIYIWLHYILIKSFRVFPSFAGQWWLLGS